MRRLFVSWFYRVVFLAIWIFQILERFWECTFRVEPRYLYRMAVSGRPLKFTRGWPELEGMWCTCGAAMRSLGPFGNSFAPSRAQHRTQHREHCWTRSVIDAQKSEKYQWKRAFWRFRIGPVMFSCWAHVEAQLGPKLNGSNLEPSCAQIEAKWIQVGPCWRELAPSWAHVADMRGRNGEFGRCCSEMRNVQITTARKSAPPSADALPLNRGLFELIGFAPKLWRADS